MISYHVPFSPSPLAMIDGSVLCLSQITQTQAPTRNWISRLIHQVNEGTKYEP